VRSRCVYVDRHSLKAVVCLAVLPHLLARLVAVRPSLLLFSLLYNLLRCVHTVCDCGPCAWDYRPFNCSPTSTCLGYSAPGTVGLSSACYPCRRIFVMGTCYTILFRLTFFLKTYILCRKIVVKTFLKVTLKVVPLYAHVSERAKLYCRPDPARESCLSFELSHLLSAP